MSSFWSKVDRCSGFSSMQITVYMVMQGRGEEKLMVRALIGSRPPICERRCMTCGHCEAVQVPVIPQERNPTRRFWGIATLRGDYSSNYKPLSWKCKCGNRIFNP
nr:PREDICTED: EPIDERMAL PATTERNING FACTOR-like protein 2 isoform X2 [Musa acuminata subsp. malaccensis]